MRKFIVRLIRDERGATALEYGMICALVFLVAVGAITDFGHNATNVFNTAGAAIDNSIK
jgi:pilus assembly protein Flp/PilA